MIHVSLSCFLTFLDMTQNVADGFIHSFTHNLVMSDVSKRNSASDMIAEQIEDNIIIQVQKLYIATHMQYYTLNSVLITTERHDIINMLSHPFPPSPDLSRSRIFVHSAGGNNIIISLLHPFSKRPLSNLLSSHLHHDNRPERLLLSKLDADIN